MRSYHYLLFAVMAFVALHALNTSQDALDERAEDRVDRILCEHSSDGTYLDRNGRRAECSDLEKT